MFDSLIAIIAPFNCIRCGLEGQLVCTDCLPQIASPKRSTCWRCNKLTLDWRTCRLCRPRTHLSGVIVVSHYENYIKDLVKKLKYERARSAAGILAQLLTAQLGSHQFDLVISVPASSRRYRQRGYNQADLIAKALARKIKLPYVRGLNRLGQTRQVGTDRRHRLTQIMDTIYTTKPQQIKGARMLVVDDVLTTGATLNECAKALKLAGVKSIWGGVIAKH